MIGLINKKIRNRKGFTLIELIVVIAILGILAVIAIPRLSGFRGQALISADVSTYNIIDNTVAIAAASGALEDGTVTAVVDADGDVTFGGTASAPTGSTLAAEMEALIQKDPRFEIGDNQGETHSWTINADGSIDSPGIDEETGVIN